jgi:hypothetical protein
MVIRDKSRGGNFIARGEFREDEDPSSSSAAIAAIIDTSRFRRGRGLRGEPAARLLHARCQLSFVVASRERVTTRQAEINSVARYNLAIRADFCRKKARNRK